VVAFATMPFSFEGRRRREQADEALNQLVVLSNALVTFDNGRMGELVLAKQGVHEAFAAADRMISESIKAVIRLVVRPGLVNVGLDDLMSALRTPRSRCLFGSGVAEGKDRATRALRNALSSPLLDQGALLRQAETVLVHLCGGEDLTLYEIELLMQGLGKHVPDDAHVLFGAAVDPGMGKSLSVTLVSALPEEQLHSSEEPDDAEETSAPPAPPVANPEASAPEEQAPESGGQFGLGNEEGPEPQEPERLEVPEGPEEAAETPEIAAEFAPPEAEAMDLEIELEAGEELDPFFEIEELSEPEPAEAEPSPVEEISAVETGEPVGEDFEFPEFGEASGENSALPEAPESGEPKEEKASGKELPRKRPSPKGKFRKIQPKQAELAFDGGPTGKFAGESPNVVDGENLDIPAFLRKKKK
jgi:cell division protein FtsZ